MELQTYLRTGMSNGMTNGAAVIEGAGQRWLVRYSGALPDFEEYVTITLVDSENGDVTVIGGGFASVIDPTFCMTHNSKVYMLADDKVLFSEIDEPTVWNNPDGVGNGYVQLSNHVKTPENLIAAVPFQGRLAFFARQTTQLWQVTADPNSWSLQQVLQNIGTIAKNSVQAKGDLDAFFLSDTGIRNLRAREVTLNAFVEDIGSPIDSFIQEKILAYPSDAVNACSVIEPSTGQYWLFLKDKIYVLSYYPSSQVTAWSTYNPVDSEGEDFVPEKFLVFQGKVYCRAGNSVLKYGGETGIVYDDTACIAELPWADLKNPGVEKEGESIHAAFTGQWRIEMAMDYQTGELNLVHERGPATSGLTIIPAPGVGNHFKARLRSMTAEASRFSSLTFKFQGGEEK
jgi:hypothetical protein